MHHFAPLPYILLSLLLLTNCKPDDKQPQDNSRTALRDYVTPAHFPKLEVPEDNKYSIARFELGRRLFHDPILSRDSTISCGSCHHQSLAFTDSLDFSIGIRNQRTARNSMPLVNIGYHNSFFWDGGVRTLEEQAMAPIENPLEMDLKLAEALVRLNRHPHYPQLFQEAYGRAPDVFSLTRALANFQRAIVGGDSPYDDYITQRDTNAMTPSQKNGMRLFFSETAECFHCHSGIFFSDFTMQNNGLYSIYADPGRGRVTGRPNDIGKFKVPSLRNVALTAPYMHDGSKQTLDQVLDHYMSGGQKNPFKSPLVRPFQLTPTEKQDLISFLHALSDRKVRTDAQFQLR
jgi:cytochrome c peroxidase